MKLYTKSLNLSVLIILIMTFTQGYAQQSKRKTRVVRSVSQSAPKVRLVSGEAALNISFDSSRNLVLMKAGVNGSAPLWFIFDTGASSSVIDAGLAKTLRLKLRGKEVGNGSAGSAEALIFKGVTLRFQNVEAANLTVAALPLDFLSYAFGRKISGIIGNDVIKEFVVEIDYASRLISFYNPQTYQYRGGGESFPMTFDGDYPFMRVGVGLDGREPLDGKFELDTGSTGAILFNAPFVKKNLLLKSVSKTKETRVGGVGGSGRTLIGRLKSISLGRLTIENSVARFFQGARGDNASAKYDGLIGGEIFRRFTVIFDYPRRKVIFEPNAQFGEPFEDDMSGLDLAAEGDDFKTVFVNEVEANSPAAQAGIQEEDVITAIDGRPAKELTLEQIHRMFMQDGREYLLDIKRGEKTLQFKIKTRRQI